MSRASVRPTPLCSDDINTNIYYCDPTVLSMLFRAEITIKLKNGMLDPEAATIKTALKHLGYECQSVKQAAIYELEFEANSRENAKEVAKGMCQRLLANPIIHDYSIELT
jgi:phosphoribosylformylglycinamidine synthase subunit PurS